MTVRGLLLSLAVLASAPVPAAARHCYSRWYYPFPQRCPIASHRTREVERWPQVALSRAVALVTPAVGERGFLPPSFTLLRRHDDDIPLPALDQGDCVGGEADELTRARLMLLGYAYAH